MTAFQRALLTLSIVALLLAVWMGRYSIVSGTRVPFVLDRWTGQVHISALTDPD